MKALAHPPRSRIATCAVTPIQTQRRCFGLDSAVRKDSAIRSQQPVKNKENEENEALLGAAPLSARDLEAPATQIVAALQKLRDPTAHRINGRPKDTHQRIIQLVTVLLRKHGYPFDDFIYSCMMDAMVDPQGSAAGVAALLKDMERADLLPSPEVCERALAALAVHPDYVLRQQVLKIMQDCWFEPNQKTEQYVLLGLLRDGQHELAYEKLTQMQRDHASIDVWVYDIFVLVFGRLGYLDEMLQVLIDRKRANELDMSFYNLAYYVLDICSNACHYHGTDYAWNAVVRSGLMKPSDGILENVLVTASRNGDFDLATEVFSMIENRGRVHGHHYDAMVEVLSKCNDLGGAIQMLRIMERSIPYLNHGHGRPIYLLLCQEPQLLDKAPEILRSLATEEPVPHVALAAVIEAMAECRGSEAAVDLYRDLQSLTSKRYHTRKTIQDMLIHCSDEVLKQELGNDYASISGEIQEEPQHEDETLGEARQIPSKPRDRQASNKLVSAFIDIGRTELALQAAMEYLNQHGSTKEPMPWLRLLAESALKDREVGLWKFVDRLTETDNHDAAELVMTIARAQRPDPARKGQTEEATLH
jgi:hypothetical protein